jgi:hypothetical protein
MELGSLRKETASLKTGATIGFAAKVWAQKTLAANWELGIKHDK